jgi:sucrose-6F-phosphate phosphohydrolase
VSGLLLCTDLDRTLIPNGDEPESPGARALFARLVARDDVTLAYVSGRHLALIEEAIASWTLPAPDFAVADVGATIHVRERGEWRRARAWDDLIGRDWQGASGDRIHELLLDLPSLKRQPPERQSVHKLSYFHPGTARPEGLLTAVRSRLVAAGFRSNVIWSVDVAAGTGLIDILPRGANKRRAVAYLAERGVFATDEVVFAGDSGNDLDVLLSPFPAVLVANAEDEMRRRTRQAAPADSIHFARGGRFGMNGNYAAGILEGVAHFVPGLGVWLERIQAEEA